MDGSATNHHLAAVAKRFNQKAHSDRTLPTGASLTQWKSQLAILLSQSSPLAIAIALAVIGFIALLGFLLFKGFSRIPRKVWDWDGLAREYPPPQAGKAGAGRFIHRPGVTLIRARNRGDFGRSTFHKNSPGC
jgi:hypothetical protein